MAVALALCSFEMRTPPETSLRIAQSIILPGVEGCIDHLAIDLPNERLFVCALGNNSVKQLYSHLAMNVILSS
jgi:hypothetical protein